MCWVGSLSTAAVAVVMFVQQHIMYYCETCTVHAYNRKTATLVGRVQQENSRCCQMCTAGKQLLLSDV
jgi:hypothetical protein